MPIDPDRRRPHSVRQVFRLRESQLDGQDYLILREDEILAVLGIGFARGTVLTFTFDTLFEEFLHVCSHRAQDFPCLFRSCFALAKPALAQTKVAVINLQRAVLESAEIKKASAEMETEYQPRQAKSRSCSRNSRASSSSCKRGRQAHARGLPGRPHRPGPAQSSAILQRMTDDLQADVEAGSQRNSGP